MRALPVFVIVAAVSFVPLPAAAQTSTPRTTSARVWMPPRTPDGQPDLFEYACHEGNRAVANILRGARAQEKAR